VLRPTLLGVEAPKVQTWCRCGGVRVLATLAWEAAGEPFTVELTSLCVECGKREGAPDED
jgi:hypothetical protein